jgi:hypothetical protein
MAGHGRNLGDPVLTGQGCHPVRHPSVRRFDRLKYCVELITEILQYMGRGQTTCGDWPTVPLRNRRPKRRQERPGRGAT